ncbi:MAG: nucleotidyltransferase domain-containing protein [Clostridium sp.]|nr:nucleotidyltransferase domain-containing protein [Clostridium sp.]
MNDFRNMWDFEVKDGVNFPHANRVHPLMQKRVQKLLELLSADGNIKKIVLFGSSLEFRCGSGSDIDVYIEKFDAALPLKQEPTLDCEVDIVSNISHESRLYLEIDKKGLLLYERSARNV